MSQALLAIHNTLQNSNIFNRSRETVFFTPLGDKSDTIFRFSRHFNELPSTDNQRIFIADQII